MSRFLGAWFSLNKFFDLSTPIPSMRTLKIQNDHHGSQNGQQGLKQVFFYLSTPSMRKLDDGEKQGKKRREL